jgi:serine/threonine protein kinase
VVFRAVRQARDEPVALKVVNATKAGREPYERFVREIKFLQAHGDLPGVLPVVDSYRPERPSKDDRPWLAMPVARSARAALDGESLRQVVEAVAAFADTLARLAAEHRAAHRDIKPGNLYELDGQWLVGDFGLVALPDVAELTRTGRPLGPMHFMAFEMLNDPVGSDPFPADVYALAKTLWVLACGQNYPPQGQQSARQRGFTIAEARPERDAELLDQLVERMTQLHPTDRPTMADVADELHRWLALREESGGVNLSGIRAQLLAKLERELAADDLTQRRKDAGAAAARRLQQLVRPLEDALRSLHPRAEIGLMPDTYARNMLSTYREMGAPEIIFSWGRLNQIGSGPDYERYALRMGYGLEVTNTGGLIYRAFIDVGHLSFGGSDFAWQASPGTAPVGSVAADELLREGVAELGTQLERAAEAFAAGVPGG